jgi:hypothetical protein
MSLTLREELAYYYLSLVNEISYELLPPSLYICHCWCACHKFNSIYRKYV